MGPGDLPGRRRRSPTSARPARSCATSAARPTWTYLTGAGIIPSAQADGSYDGTPANFVAAGGKDAQQGFASAEPYIYENEVADWGKPVEYQLINDAGYPDYAVGDGGRTADTRRR